MALLGKAVVAIWNDITPEGRLNFTEWHNREHIPERVSITGFLRGRRYIALQGAPEYFTLYEASDAGVLVGNEYLTRLNNPTEWTRNATAEFRNTTRGVCETVESHGPGAGGYLLTARFDNQPANLKIIEAFAGGLARLSETPGVSGVHLCLADAAASGLETAERKGRQVDVPSGILLVEGAPGAPLEKVAAELARAFASAGESEPEIGVYQLEYGLTDTGGGMA